MSFARAARERHRHDGRADAWSTNIWQAIYGGGFVRLLRALSHHGGDRGGGADGRRRWRSASSARRRPWPGSVSSWCSIPVLALTRVAAAVSRATERWANPLIGVASGAAAGITGVAAVPFLPYMQSLDIDRHELVQALGIMFLFIMGALAAALAIQGAFTAANLLGGVAAIAPTFAGVWLGQKARHAALGRDVPARSSCSACSSSACKWREACCRIAGHAPAPPTKSRSAASPSCRCIARLGVSHVLSIIDTHEPRPPALDELSRDRPRADPLRRRRGRVSRLRGLHARSTS